MIIIIICNKFITFSTFMMDKMNSRGSQAPSGDTAYRAARRLPSHELFAGHPRLLIEHEGAEYLLQVTRQGKLILTK